MKRLVCMILVIACSGYVAARYHHLAHVAIPVEDEPKESTTTEVQVESGRQAPYSYYYIGRKLWYIPLYFSLYFVIYVAALIIRAIARHKVTFPERLPTNARAIQSRLDRATATVSSAIDTASARYM